MQTSVNVSIQQLNTTVYTNHKLFLTIDPAFNIAGTSAFILEGKIRRVASGINENLAQCDLEFPLRVFGNHVGTFVLPIAVFLDNTNNFIFRGFFTDEDGVVSESADEVHATCHDYKWLIGRFSKIRGKIFTVDNNIYPPYSRNSPNVFVDDSMYERFRLVIPGLNSIGQDITNNGITITQAISGPTGTGYLGTEKTIFNEHGDPNCSSNNPYASVFGSPAFMFDSDLQYNRGLNVSRRSVIKYKWNYATMLRYVCDFYITNIFNGIFGTTAVLLNETSISTIMQYGNLFGMELIEPINLDITGKSPIEAIDFIVKHIPGSWYWRLLYSPNTVLIDIQNHSVPSLMQAKKYLFLGTGGKLNNKTNNNVNVASANVRVSAKNAISHAVAVGGGIDVETSVQYLPGWPQYIRPISDFNATKLTDFGADTANQWDGISPIDNQHYISDFKGINDYNNWKQWLHKDTRHPTTTSSRVREAVSSDDQHRYALIYRVYSFPENQFQITKFPSVYIKDLLGNEYGNYATYLDQLFFRFVLKKRKIKAPITQYRSVFQYAPFTDSYNYQNVKEELKDKHHSDPPFVFMYDALAATTLNPEGAGIANADTLLQSKQWILPQEEKHNSYQFEQENRVLVFKDPQFMRQTSSVSKLEDFVEMTTFQNIQSRNVFVSCRIECDVPLIKDQIANRSYYSNARLVSQDIHTEANVTIRINAFYPNPQFYAGTDLNVSAGSDSDIVSTLDDGGITTPPIIGNKLVNWNNVVLGNNAPTAMVVQDDSFFLDQVLQFLLYDRPIYEIDSSFDLGRIDASYVVGDLIDGIKGSELSDGTGGYYGMNCVIDKFEYTAVGEKNDTYTTKGSMRNILPIVDHFKNKAAVRPHHKQ